MKRYEYQHQSFGGCPDKATLGHVQKLNLPFQFFNKKEYRYHVNDATNILYTFVCPYHIVVV